MYPTSQAMLKIQQRASAFFRHIPIWMPKSTCSTSCIPCSDSMAAITAIEEEIRAMLQNEERLARVDIIVRASFAHRAGSTQQSRQTLQLWSQDVRKDLFTDNEGSRALKRPSQESIEKIRALAEMFDEDKASLSSSESIFDILELGVFSVVPLASPSAVLATGDDKLVLHDTNHLSQSEHEAWLSASDATDVAPSRASVQLSLNVDAGGADEHRRTFFSLLRLPRR